MAKCEYPGCGLEKRDDWKFCLFHAPTKGEVNGTEFQLTFDRLRAGHYFNFRGFRFKWPIALSGEILPQETSFADAVFESDVSFVSTVFEGKEAFERTRFRAHADFRNAQFRNGATFNECTFKPASPVAAKGNVLFTSCSFAGEFNLDDCQFDVADLRIDNLQMAPKVTIDGGGISARTVLLSPRLGLKGESVNLIDLKMNFDGLVIGGFAVEMFNIISKCEFKGRYVSVSNLSVGELGLCVQDCSFSIDDVIRFDSLRIREMTTFKLISVKALRTIFTDSEFRGRLALFESLVLGSTLEMNDCRFAANLNRFIKIDCSISRFEDCSFAGRVEFTDSDVRQGLSFGHVSFPDKSSFEMKSIRLHSSNAELPNGLFFEHTNLRSTHASFIAISRALQQWSEEVSEGPIMAFRYCDVEGTYFSEDDLSMISFYTSKGFDSIHTTGCHWPWPRGKWLPLLPGFRRGYVLPEERYLVARTKKGYDELEATRMQLSGLKQFAECATMYRQLKSSADSSKDYSAASTLYFNEMEMRRKLSWETITTAIGERRLIQRFSEIPKSLVFWIYRSIAGYGERPDWALFWFLGGIVLFSCLNMLSGIAVQSEGVAVRTIDYELDSSGMYNLVSIRFWGDFLTSATLTISKVVPSSLLPGQTGSISSLLNPPYGVLFSILQSVVLLILLGFFAMGLKRYFRRY